MDKITKAQFDTLVRVNDFEVYTEEQINNWVVDVAETVNKAEIGGADALEKSETETFNEEFRSFTKVEVVGPPVKDSLHKGVVYETFYVREKQVEFEEVIQKGEDGEPLKGEDGEIEKARTGRYTDTGLNRKLGRVGQQYGKKGTGGEDEGSGKSSKTSEKNPKSEEGGKSAKDRFNESHEAQKKLAKEMVGKINTEHGDYFSKLDQHTKNHPDIADFDDQASYDSKMHEYRKDQNSILNTHKQNMNKLNAEWDSKKKEFEKVKQDALKDSK